MVSVLLCGCSNQDDMEEALAMRSRLLGEGCSFCCDITADYIDYVEEFELQCMVDREGMLEFEVAEPHSIRGIRGSVSGREGTLDYEDLVLAFPLMADDRLSPVAAPWILVQALRTGYITACVREGEQLHLTVDDSYGEDPLTLEIWLEDGKVEACEIGWRGRRMLSMEVEDFALQ